MKVVSIVGNLGANAVRRVTSDGREFMTFSVAVNDGKDSVTWFNCTANMRKNFDFLIKGQCVAVSGDLSIGVYRGNPDIVVNADRIELVGGKSDNAQSNATSGGVNSPA